MGDLQTTGFPKFEMKNNWHHLEIDMKQNKLKNYHPLLADVLSFKRFAGNYVVTGTVVKMDNAKRQFKEITISDGSGDITVKCTNFELMGVEIPFQSLVYIEAALTQKYGQAEFVCKNLVPVTNYSSLGPDLSVLPRSLCPNSEAFDGLLIIAERIREPLLRTFLREVLLTPDIGLKYLQCPASLNYHHNFPGGLIQHSVSVAWNLSGIQAFNSLDRDIAVVAALLHDVGKTKTLTPDMTRTAIGRLVDHSQLTLELCAEPLRKLECRAPGIAYHLRHAWTCYSPGARFGFKAKTFLAKRLQYVDNKSAKSPLWQVPDFNNESLEWMKTTRVTN